MNVNFNEKIAIYCTRKRGLYSSKSGKHMNDWSTILGGCWHEKVVFIFGIDNRVLVSKQKSNQTLNTSLIAELGLIIMDSAANNNSSLQQTIPTLSSFDELPDVEIGTGWASESSTSATDELFLTVQIRPYCPAAPARFDKEVAISSSFQLENLGERKTEVHNI